MSANHFWSGRGLETPGLLRLQATQTHQTGDSVLAATSSWIMCLHICSMRWMPTWALFGEPRRHSVVRWAQKLAGNRGTNVQAHNSLLCLSISKSKRRVSDPIWYQGGI